MQDLEAAKIWYPNTAGLSYRHFDIGSLSDGRALLAFGGNSRFDATVNTALHHASTDTPGPVTSTLSALSNLVGPSAAKNRVTITAGANGKAQPAYQFNNTNMCPPDGNFSVATQPFWRGGSTDAHTESGRPRRRGGKHNAVLFNRGFGGWALCVIFHRTRCRRNKSVQPDPHDGV